MYNVGMIQRKSTFFLGIFILIVSSSFLGLPSAWKTILVFFSGITLVVLSVKFTLPKKSLKRLNKKEKTTPVIAESSKVQGTPAIEIAPIVQKVGKEIAPRKSVRRMDIKQNETETPK